MDNPNRIQLFANLLNRSIRFQALGVCSQESQIRLLPILLSEHCEGKALENPP